LAVPANKLSSLELRIATALVLGGAALAALILLPDSGWAVLVLCIVAAGAWEWSALIRLSRPLRVAYTLVTPLLCAVSMQFIPADAWAFVGLFWLVVAPVWLYRGWPMPSGTGGLLPGWLVLVPTGLAAIELRQIDWTLPLAAIVLAVIADSSAYFSGRRFGRHKLAPEISPGKTWEGAAGALAGVSLYALAVATGFESCPLPCLGKLLLAAWILLAVSIIGDLFESHAKRQAGVKDSGQILPGHGGVLDRIDSLTAVLPTAMLLWIWLK